MKNLTPKEAMQCAREGCNEIFVPKSHNNKFHDAECLRVETNRRVKEKYYDDRDRKRGKERHCKVCRTTKLSRYNITSTCAGCESKKESERNKELAAMLSQVA